MWGLLSFWAARFWVYDGRSMTEISGQEAVLPAQQKFHMPAQCCRCGQPGTKQRTSSVAVVGLGRRTRSVTFPYCDACDQRAAGITRARTVLLLGLVALSIAVSLIGFAVPALPKVVLWIVPVALATFAAVLLRVRAGESVEAPNGAWLSRATNKSTTFFMSNPTWAQEFAARNQLQELKATTRKDRFLLWPWMLLVAAIAAGIVASVTHPDVYVDNEGLAPLQIWVDGKKSIVAEPMSSTTAKRPTIEVPYGTHKLGYSPVGASAPVSETPPTKIKVAGDHLYNPGSTACYFLDLTVYGNETGKGVVAGPVPLAELYTFKHVDNWFRDNPSSVSTKSSGETRVALKPFEAGGRVVCSEFADCPLKVRADLMECLKTGYDSSWASHDAKTCFIDATKACSAQGKP